jgi:MoaA/NifB/PqqE/SkfB family radical SAM enzyme
MVCWSTELPIGLIPGHIFMAKDSGDRHDFWASFLVMKENLEEIEDFICVAHSLGINNIRFMHLNPNWRSFWGVRMSPDFTFKYLEQSNKSVINTFRQRFSQYQEMAAKLGVNIRTVICPPGWWRPII